MTCLTCDHYEPMPYRADRVTSLCMNGRIREWYVDAAYRECRGKLHSGYVSVWRRVWRWVTRTNAVGIPATKPEFDFEGRQSVSLFQERGLDMSGMSLPKLLQLPPPEPKYDFSKDEPREAGLWR